MSPATLSEAVGLGDRAAFAPFRSAPPGFTLDLPAFLSFTFPPAGLAPGTYRVFAALVRQGALADGRIDAGDVPALDLMYLLRYTSGCN